MAEITLVYTGPLAECGLSGKAGRSYLVRPLEPFAADPGDVDYLLGKFPGVVKLFEPESEPKEPRRARHPAPKDTKPAASGFGDASEIESGTDD